MKKIRLPLDFYVISEVIGDHTDRFACHRHEQCDRGGNVPREFLGSAPSLEEVHRLLPEPNMTRNDALPSDGPLALEVWM